MPSPESIKLGQQEGEIKPPEAIEKPETPEERTIREFDEGTADMQKQKVSLEGRVSRMETQISMNEKLRVPSSVNADIQKDIAELKGQIQPLTEELGKREPSAEENAAQQEIGSIDARILRIKNEQKLHPAPARIEEGRNKDIEELEGQRTEKMKEQQQIKLESIKKYQAGKEAPAKEAAPKVEAAMPKPEEQPQRAEAAEQPKAQEMEKPGNEEFEKIAEARARENLGPDQVDFLDNGMNSEYAKRRIEEIRTERTQRAIADAYNGLSEQERGGKSQREFEFALEAERDKLAGQGIKISKDAFWQMRKNGTKVQRAGLLTRFFSNTTAILINKDGSKESRSGTQLAQNEKDNDTLAQREAMGKLQEELDAVRQQKERIKGIHMRGLAREEGVAPAAEAAEAPVAAAAEAVAEEPVSEAPEGEAAVGAEEIPAEAEMPAAPEAEQKNNWGNVEQQYANIKEKIKAKREGIEVTPEQAAEMKQMKSRIAAAENINALLGVLENGINDYWKKEGSFSYPQLVKGIVACLAEKNSNYVTRTLGLRAKVEKLTGIKPKIKPKPAEAKKGKVAVSSGRKGDIRGRNVVSMPARRKSSGRPQQKQQKNAA